MTAQLYQNLTAVKIAFRYIPRLKDVGFAHNPYNRLGCCYSPICEAINSRWQEAIDALSEN